MGLTSEQVHWLYGAALIFVAAVLLLRAGDIVRRPWPDFLVGGALLVFGLALVFDPWLHGEAAPGDYGAETAQHLLLGLALLVASALELYRAASGRQAFAWRLPLILALIGASLIFALHAQHDAAAPMVLLVTQHRFIAATLLVLALAVALAPTGGARLQNLATPLIVLLLGFQFLLYTEGNSLLGMPDHEALAGGAMHDGAAGGSHP
ncbi:hypothetical protein RCO27_14315 [Sphingosinicella sp. LHD-64]|uniref:hypothetical protein n=1 Tax=Sphingosinicella sp. LHD-64 TaxID=3072139 RepID=UPI00280F8DEE|nr:hypothetical protein [Sphingosinicella sp. LHD-64]MDQ8757401.1 hypothetical protein [Sphingosinicella sp. LHD-64]